MLEHLEKLIVEAGKACEAIKAYNGTLRVVSHYDADGITSAAIFLKALARAGKRFHHSFVRQLEEPIVRELAVEKPEFVVLLDLGSGQLEWIGKYLAQAFKVVVVDHHQPQGEAKNVVHINPLLFGIEENVSGAGMCYLMARTLSPENKDLSELAIVGAIADSQQGGEREWGLQGLNREIMKDAQETGKLKVTTGLRIWGRRSRALHKALEYGSDVFVPGVTGSESGAVQFLQELGIPLKNDGEWRTLSELTEEEQKKLASAIVKVRVQGGEDNPDWVFGDVYELPSKGEWANANELATLINATGKQNKAHVGLAVCWNAQGGQDEAERVLDGYRREIGKSIRWVEENKKMVKRTNAYFAVCGDGVSSDVISNVISILNKSTYADLPVFGFADAGEGKVKISARASGGLVDNGLNLKDVVSAAAKKTGGEGGGHAGAAGGLIPAGTEEAFISLTENILSGLCIANRRAQPNGHYGKENSRQGSQQEGGSEGANKGTEARGSEGANGTTVDRAERGEGSSGQKVEGKGLVRYFGAAAV